MQGWQFGWDASLFHSNVALVFVGPEPCSTRTAVQQSEPLKIVSGTLQTKVRLEQIEELNPGSVNEASARGFPGKGQEGLMLK